MSKRFWTYCGDIHIEDGGWYWREDGADDYVFDYVLAVNVTPCSDGGGPDNLFWIEQGSIYMPLDYVRQKAALGAVGVTPDMHRVDCVVPSPFGTRERNKQTRLFKTEFEARMFAEGCKHAKYLGLDTPRAVLVEAFKAYSGLDGVSTTMVRIGPREKARNRAGAGNWEKEPDVILRAGTSLRNYVIKNYLD